MGDEEGGETVEESTEVVTETETEEETVVEEAPDEVEPAPSAPVDGGFAQPAEVEGASQEEE